MKEKTEKKEVRKQLLITESLDKRFREHLTGVARERKGIISFNKYVAELMERAICEKDNLFDYSDNYFRVDIYTGAVEPYFFDISDFLTVADMAMDNIFRTPQEAEAHKEEMLAKFEEARKKYVRM